MRERGHGQTPQRYAVVRALVEGGEHPCAEQLYHRVSDAYPMMSRTTVYKTLDTLNAHGASTYPIYKCSLTLLARHQDVEVTHGALTKTKFGNSEAFARSR